MSIYYISCLNKDTYKTGHFKVPGSIYIYIKQLEQAIQFPNNTRIRDAYPDRFDQAVENTS